MQNKGAIRIFAIVFALVCLYQLSFTYVTGRVENKAKAYANSEEAYALASKLAKGDEVMTEVKMDSISKAWERAYLEDMGTKPVYNLLITKFTYNQCKDKELNLGLDLKGGMNVTMEVKVVDIINSMVKEQADSTFRKAIALAQMKQKSRTSDFVTLFDEAWQEVGGGKNLAPYFIVEFKNEINPKTPDDEVLRLVRRETEDAIERSFNILRSRIDRFGVAQPNIQRLPTSGRILVELPGIKEPERVRKLLQSSAKLEFFRTYNEVEIYNALLEANERSRRLFGDEIIADTNDAEAIDPLLEGIQDETSVEGVEEELSLTDALDSVEEGSLLERAESLETDVDPGEEQGLEDFLRENPLFGLINIGYTFGQNEQGQAIPANHPLIGYVVAKDTARVNRMLKHPQIRTLFPRDLRFMWTVDTRTLDLQDGTSPEYHQLIAIRTERNNTPALGGEKVVNAFQDFEQSGEASVTMMMNSEGAQIWRRLTANNIKRVIAIALDGYIYSYPTVQDEIPGGRSSITGNFDLEEAKDLANILKSGKLPAPAHIVQEEVVGPSLGLEAINAGLISFIIAFFMVLLYMFAYYNRAGLVADIALVTNVFFIFGVLASLGAVLTLPGIAGIVLTLGMAVDANVIIYERIKEEVRAGKGSRLAISDGYKNAYSAIIDGNVTTLLTGVVLALFGSGPVKGFATTLIIGIITSLFSAIFLSRLIFTYMLDKNMKFKFGNKFTENFLAKLNLDFMGMRKRMYMISATLIIIGALFLTFKGLNLGVDFSGGRTYVVRFDNQVNTNDLRKSIGAAFIDENGREVPPEVKTFGRSNQVKITTKFMIDAEGEQVDSIMERALFAGVKDFYTEPLAFNDFASDDEEKVLGRMSSQLVGPTIADDIKRNSVMAIAFALIIIFIYIAVRFRRWQFGLGGVIALFHDSIIAVSMYSIFYGILPFSLEVDQAFVAAVLTIIGYSINDTVIIFDRIREYTLEHPKRTLKENFNGAINSTMARSINTSGTTFVVLLIIFLFGGEVIRGFAFILMVGVLIGTYSSIFNASSIAYDMLKGDKQLAEAQKAKKA